MKNYDFNRKLVLDFLGYVDLELNLAKNTIAAYRQDLHAFCDFLRENQDLKLTGIKDLEILDYILSLHKKGLTAKSTARKLSSIKHLFKFLLGEGVIADDPTSILETPKLIRSLPEVLSKKEVENLINAVEGDSLLNIRDRAILELWYACGLRISELAELKIGDIMSEVEVIRVRGKGDKQRLVPFGKYAQKALEDYLSRARPKLQKAKSFDILFLSQKGGKLSRMGLWSIFVKYCQKAGLSKPVTPHVLRHSCATHMIEGGADIRTVMEFLGHADITTTQIYTHLDQKYLMEVHRQCHPRDKEDDRKYGSEDSDVDVSAGDTG